MYLVVLSSWWCQSIAKCHVMYKLRHLKTSFWKLKLKGENELTPGFADELDDLRHGKLQNDDDAKKKMKNLDESILQQDNIVIPKERNSDGVNVGRDA